MSPTCELLAAVQAWLYRLEWSPAVTARLTRVEAYLIRRMLRDE